MLGSGEGEGERIALVKGLGEVGGWGYYIVKGVEGYAIQQVCQISTSPYLRFPYYLHVLYMCRINSFLPEGGGEGMYSRV